MQIGNQKYPFLEGMKIPKHDAWSLDESDPSSIVFTYTLNGVTVATKTIDVSGTTTTATLVVV